MSGPMIRVLICDDQWIVCEGLELILGSDPEIEVVGLASDGAEALIKVGETQPDVVLMDLKMPVMNGVQATRKIKAEFPEFLFRLVAEWNSHRLSPGERRRWASRARSAPTLAAYLPTIFRDDHPASRMRSVSCPPLAINW